VLAAEGQRVLGWRDVPFDASTLRRHRAAEQPVIRQVFVAAADGPRDPMAFERKLYVMRARCPTKSILRSNIPGRREYYVASLSARTMVYKGMLNAGAAPRVLPGPARPGRWRPRIAMVHSRFSTNTFPSWSRAHPYRFISHNGEINTLRGNINWMHARQSRCSSAAVRRRPRRRSCADRRHRRLATPSMFDNVLRAARTWPAARCRTR